MSALRAVALGGGHGLAAALASLRLLTTDICAVVSVADDGGSSGRLVRDLGVPPPGDARRCLVALSDDGDVAELFDYRFSHGVLEGHALGNLVLAALTDMSGSFTHALGVAGDLLGASGRVLPAAVEPVRLVADVGGAEVEGQTVLAATSGIRRLRIDPPGPKPSPEAVQAILDADLVLLGPGSLFTSILPVLCVPELLVALADSPALVVFVANLTMQRGETQGMDLTEHARVLFDYVAPEVVDAMLVNDGPVDRGDPLDVPAVEALFGVPLATAPLARQGSALHDPTKLAAALGSVLASR